MKMLHLICQLFRLYDCDLQPNDGSQSYMRNSRRMRCNAFTCSKMHNIDARPYVILP